MDLVGAVKVCFVKYTNFSDRASRSEFWFFILFLTILGIVVGFIDGAMGVFWGAMWAPGNTIVTIVTFVPALSVTARRLHDVNRSGWWMLIYFTLIGILFPLLYWWCRKGDEGENRFGPKPIA
jgi:uncharacterized membrane protein YhaH (DUF805 family)